MADQYDNLKDLDDYQLVKAIRICAGTRSRPTMAARLAQSAVCWSIPTAIMSPHWCSKMAAACPWTRRNPR